MFEMYERWIDELQKHERRFFRRFFEPIKRKRVSDMRVQDVIDKADVGRSTFYAHYASKEALLEELCHDLFHHLFTGREDSDVTVCWRIFSNIFG